MTTFYSEHYSGRSGLQGESAESGHWTTRSQLTPVLPAAEVHGRLRKKTARILIPAGTDMGDDDIIRVMDFKSSDRIFDLLVSMDADFGATTTFNIGLYVKGSLDDGAVIDEDLFGSAIDWSGAIARVDYFKESATLTDMDRGKPLWFLADKGGGTYTQDPQQVWTLVFQTTQDISAVAAAVEILVEVNYLAGD